MPRAGGMVCRRPSVETHPHDVVAIAGLRPVDDHAAQWVVNCFYVAAEHRGSGIATELLDVATRFAFARGAARLEAYPIDSGESRWSSAQLFTGTLGMFLEAGYVEIPRTIRRHPSRMVVRLYG